MVLLAGDPGIGKTRLAEEVAAKASTHGARVLVGRAHDGVGAPPFWPWTQVVRSYLTGADPDVISEDLGPGAAEIAQIVPELSERVAHLSVRRRYHRSRRDSDSLTASRAF